MRARPAMRRGDSMRQTASIARCVSVAVTATDHSIFKPRAQPRLLLRRQLRPQPLLLGPQLGRELGAEVVGLEDLPDLDLRLALVGIGAALDPLDALLFRLHLPQPEPRDQLLGLRERAVDHGPPGPR